MCFAAGHDQHQIPQRRKCTHVGRNAKTVHIMKHVFILLTTLLAISICSNGQDSTLLKRTPYTLRVDVDKNHFYEDKVGGTPYVFPDKTIQIYPGETIYVEVVEENGVVKNMTAVQKIKNPSITLTIAFTQTTKNKVHEMMMLKIENPFPKDLSYNATMFLFKQNRWVNTNVYPVTAKLSAFETWNDIIITLGLGNWKFIDK